MAFKIESPKISRYTYEDGFDIFFKLGYDEGFEGYCLVNEAVTDLYVTLPISQDFNWKAQTKAFRYGCHVGYTSGWHKGYTDACKNELWLFDTMWQLRGEAPTGFQPSRTELWTEDFQRGPPIRPMAVPSHLRHQQGE